MVHENLQAAGSATVEWDQNKTGATQTEHGRGWSGSLYSTRCAIRTGCYCCQQTHHMEVESTLFVPRICVIHKFIPCWSKPSTSMLVSRRMSESKLLSSGFLSLSLSLSLSVYCPSDSLTLHDSSKDINCTLAHSLQVCGPTL